MFLKNSTNDHIVEILNITELFSPFNAEVVGCYHYGEEVQEPEKFRKKDLIFLSGEDLPKCWVDSHYRNNEVKR